MELWNSGKYFDPKLQYLDFNVYKKVIDEGAERGTTGCPSYRHDGEPTLHKQLPEMISYAREKGIVDVFTHSLMLQGYTEPT